MWSCWGVIGQLGWPRSLEVFLAILSPMKGEGGAKSWRKCFTAVLARVGR